MGLRYEAYPFLRIARDFGLDYGTVLCFAEHLRSTHLMVPPRIPRFFEAEAMMFVHRNIPNDTQTSLVLQIMEAHEMFRHVDLDSPTKLKESLS